MEIPYSAFSFQSTEDKSLTLRVSTDEGLSEAMHSLKGAFSETAYIYGSAIEYDLSHGFRPRVLSLGLGLGYVELLAVGMALKYSAHLGPDDLETFLRDAGGESFELLAPLRRWFAAWALKGSSGSEAKTAYDSVAGLTPADSQALNASDDIPSDFSAAYDAILNRTAGHVGVAPDLIRRTLARMLIDGRWKLRPALDNQTKFSESFGCVCFDAFSSKTSPDLWTEEFLRDFFAKTCETKCVLSTYACTGALKRALRAAGFELTIREGFASKRDSTFAVRAQPTA